MLVIVTTLVASLSASAITFKCPPLSFKGDMPVGSPGYEIEKTATSATLISVPINPAAKKEKSKMKLVQAGPGSQQYTYGDLDAFFTYNPRAKKNMATLRMVGNSDWSSICEEQKPKAKK